MSTATKRIGQAVIDAAVNDFIESGYIAMVTGPTKHRKFQVTKDYTLDINYFLSKSTELFTFTLTNTVSGRQNIVDHALKRGNIGLTRTAEIIGVDVDYIDLGTRLAKAFALLYDRLDALGQIKVLDGAANGHSATEKDGVSEVWTASKNNAPLGGRSN